MNICIIPARGGSKRIPKKNIKDFLGKPIIAYSIEVAVKSQLFDEVMVSTDDKEIAEVAEKYGAVVPFLRSAKNSDDYSTTADVLLEVLKHYGIKKYQYTCCIYPTAPFVSVKSLSESFQQLDKCGFDSVFPVVPFSYPIQRALKVVDDKVSMVWEEHLKSRSQDLDERYHDTGQFYWFNIKTFIEKEQLFTNNSGAYVIDELNAQDIDNETDWKLAELKYKLLKQ
ncbi:MAG: pseudaminic acid cytidylyltransferase [Kiritimatiellae bacterium]|jgi:pseudaminic acid cytidylyltransferase|nr:pseudaminic acid cytidylyltransferase [Kiritimatiellia bacterium]